MCAKKTETSAKVPVDIQKCLRVSKKVLDLLQKRTNNSAEAYFAVRLVGIFLEEKLGSKLHQNRKKNSESSGGKTRRHQPKICNLDRALEQKRNSKRTRMAHVPRVFAFTLPTKYMLLV